ncbi:MAG: hypothetical protein ABI364_09440 [Caldimonas sp.]
MQEPRRPERAFVGVNVAGLTIDASIVAGVSVFALAAATCARTARRTTTVPTWWRALAGVNAACAVEVLLGLRYRLHNLVIAPLQELGWYSARSPWQAVAIVTLVALALVLVAVVAWRRRGDAALVVATFGTALALALLAVEAISLHRVDAMMYAFVGPLVVVAWLWAGAAALVTGSAFAAARP